MIHDHESVISLNQLKTADFKEGRGHSDLLLCHTTYQLLFSGGGSCAAPSED